MTKRKKKEIAKNDEGSLGKEKSYSAFVGENRGEQRQNRREAMGN